jgi:hypothetical protein
MENRWHNESQVYLLFEIMRKRLETKAANNGLRRLRSIAF